MKEICFYVVAVTTTTKNIRNINANDDESWMNKNDDQTQIH